MRNLWYVVCVVLCAVVWISRYVVETDVPLENSMRLKRAAPREGVGLHETQIVPSGNVDPHEGWCDFSRLQGSWSVVGKVEEGEGFEHILHWRPETSSCVKAEMAYQYHRFSQSDALRCLEGKNLLFYGNSNTRTLYIALEALLRGARMTSRVAAKQMCDNTRHNHSCWANVSAVVDGVPFRPVRMHYVSYVDDLFHESLPKKMLQIPFVNRRETDLVIANSGLNVIQLQDDAVFLRAHRSNAPKLRDFATSFFGDRATFVWHKTTPVCANQPHFKRYRYNAKHWRYRTLDQINKAVVASNTVVEDTLVPKKPSLLILDDWAMISRQEAKSRIDLCPFFEDPLHHRFLDREVIQVLLNEICPQKSR
jgi:hypothetical protein